MPYAIVKRKNSTKPYCVVAKGDPKKKYGCHATKAKALKQIAALKIHVDEEAVRVPVGTLEFVGGMRRLRLADPAEFIDGTFVLMHWFDVDGGFVVVGRRAGERAKAFEAIFPSRGDAKADMAFIESPALSIAWEKSPIHANLTLWDLSNLDLTALKSS